MAWLWVDYGLRVFLHFAFQVCLCLIHTARIHPYHPGPRDSRRLLQLQECLLVVLVCIFSLHLQQKCLLFVFSCSLLFVFSCSCSMLLVNPNPDPLVSCQECQECLVFVIRVGN